MKYLLPFLLFFSAHTLYGVITIAPVEIGAHPGWSTTLKGSFETRRGNSDVDNYSAGIRSQYDNNSSYILWGDVSFSYGKASGVTNTNKSYAHIRYIHTTTFKPLNYELFVQSEQNKFTMVQRRRLGGVGGRYHFNNHNYGNIYIGIGLMAENIAYTTQQDPAEENIRFNNYIAYTKSFNKKSRFSYVAYYQPKANDVSDYIFSNGVELELLVYQKLYINFVMYYDVDSQPAVGVKKVDIAQKTSFVYKF